MTTTKGYQSVLFQVLLHFPVKYVEYQISGIFFSLKLLVDQNIRWHTAFSMIHISFNSIRTFTISRKMIRYYSMTTLKIQRYTEYTCTCISRILMYTYCICPWGKFQNGTSPFLLGHNEIEDIPILMTDRCNDNNNQYLVYIFRRKSLNTRSTIIKCFRGWQLWFYSNSSAKIIQM